jgi:tetratricopeptide (TPR) repeat protein
MDSHQVLARFEAERQALAIMDHPNIAKVFDAGATDSGRPYFIMELIKGEPITEFCDRNQFTPQQRLELFAQVCHAVQHAHQKGIIHRDIKPTNVLVGMHDTTPVVKVIDFGVAKALGQELTDKTVFTGFAQFLGTPLYMSPEQAGQSVLDVDTRSDIYSLGVLLYELLTGTTPFDKERFKKAAQDEIFRIIREEEPPKPSTRLSSLSPGERAGVREQPSTGNSTLPERRAVDASTIAAQRQMEPAKLTRLVRGELDWIVMKALEKDRSRRYETANGLARDVERYLHNEPVAACPPSTRYRLRKFVRRNKATVVMVSVVTLAVLLVVGSLGWVMRDRTAREERIARDRAARQAAVKERVTLALEEARTRHQEGRWREALDAAKRAEALAASSESDEVTQQRAREVLGDMQMLANLEDARENSTKNSAGFDLTTQDQSTARAFREYGIDIDALDRDAAAMRIGARSIRYELAVFLDSWSHVRRRLAEQGSQQIGKDWRELLEVARAADPDPWRDQFRTAVRNGDAKALIQIAETAPISSLSAETVDRLGDALMSISFKDAGAFLKKGQRRHPQHYWINLNLGRCLSSLGQRDEAIRYYTAAVALRPEASWTHFHLGSALHAEKKLDDAIAEYRKGIELDPNYAYTYIKLGGALREQKKVDEAIAAEQKAIEVDPKNALVHNSLAWALVTFTDAKFRDPVRALALAKRAVELDPQNGAYLNTLGAAYYRAGESRAAIAALKKSMELRNGGDSCDWFFLAMAEWQLGNKDAAREWYGKGVEWMETNAPANLELLLFRAEAAELLGVNDEEQYEFPDSAATSNSETPEK